MSLIFNGGGIYVQLKWRINLIVVAHKSSGERVYVQGEGSACIQ